MERARREELLGINLNPPAAAFKWAVRDTGRSVSPVGERIPRVVTLVESLPPVRRFRAARSLELPPEPPTKGQPEDWVMVPIRRILDTDAAFRSTDRPAVGRRRPRRAARRTLSPSGRRSVSRRPDAIRGDPRRRLASIGSDEGTQRVAARSRSVARSAPRLTPPPRPAGATARFAGRSTGARSAQPADSCASSGRRGDCSATSAHFSSAGQPPFPVRHMNRRNRRNADTEPLSDGAGLDSGYLGSGLGYWSSAHRQRPVVPSMAWRIRSACPS